MTVWKPAIHFFRKYMDMANNSSRTKTIEYICLCFFYIFIHVIQTSVLVNRKQPNNWYTLMCIYDVVAVVAVIHGLELQSQKLHRQPMSCSAGYFYEIGACDSSSLVTSKLPTVTIRQMLLNRHPYLSLFGMKPSCSLRYHLSAALRRLAAFWTMRWILIHYRNCSGHHSVMFVFKSWISHLAVFTMLLCYELAHDASKITVREKKKTWPTISNKSQQPPTLVILC